MDEVGHFRGPALAPVPQSDPSSHKRTLSDEGTPRIRDASVISGRFRAWDSGAVAREGIELQRCRTCGSTALFTFEFDSKGIPRMYGPLELDAHEDYFLTVLGEGIVITCQDCGHEQPFSTWGTRGA